LKEKPKSSNKMTYSMGGEVYSAVKAGKLDIAVQRLTDKAIALRNSGRENDAKAAERAIQVIEANPTGAQTTIGLIWLRLPGGKDIS
jgi:hypothetical protein